MVKFSLLAHNICLTFLNLNNLSFSLSTRWWWCLDVLVPVMILFSSSLLCFLLLNMGDKSTGMSSMCNTVSKVKLFELTGEKILEYWSMPPERESTVQGTLKNETTCRGISFPCWKNIWICSWQIYYCLSCYRFPLNIYKTFSTHRITTSIIICIWWSHIPN